MRGGIIKLTSKLVNMRIFGRKTLSNPNSLGVAVSSPQSRESLRETD